MRLEKLTCATVPLMLCELMPLQGQKFRDMRTFFQNCPRDYDDNIELWTDELARKLMSQQARAVASSWECDGKLTNWAQEKARRERSHSTTCMSRVQSKLENHAHKYTGTGR